MPPPTASTCAVHDSPAASTCEKHALFLRLVYFSRVLLMVTRRRFGVTEATRGFARGLADASVFDWHAVHLWVSSLACTAHSFMDTAARTCFSVCARLSCMRGRERQPHASHMKIEEVGCGLYQKERRENSAPFPPLPRIPHCRLFCVRLAHPLFRRIWRCRVAAFAFFFDLPPPSLPPRHWTTLFVRWHVAGIIHE